MKSILLAAALFPLFVSAQDCKLVRDTDPYTKETKLSSGFITLQGGALGSLTIDADSKEIDFYFTVTDKCFNDQSTLFVFFEGTKTKGTYHNAGSMNCSGDFHVIFRNGASTNTQLQKLGTVKVTQFVFNNADKKPTTITLTPEEQDIFMKSASCVITEAKTLVK
jgi:hypothetical protein